VVDVEAFAFDCAYERLRDCFVVFNEKDGSHRSQSYDLD
jgi:hypothetical protein